MKTARFGMGLVAAIGMTIVVSSAEATTFVCKTQQSYRLESGALKPDDSKWPDKWTFNDMTGHLDYGQSRLDKLTVTTRNSTFNVSAHYMHNGAILSAIEFRIKEGAADIVWLKGANSLLLSGTCDLIRRRE